MRRMSFVLTQEQIKNKTKTVTRRLGWAHAKPGMEVLAVSKCQGLKPGEKAEIFGVIRFLDVRMEKLSLMLSDCAAGGYGDIEAAKEGFPELGGSGFMDMFGKHMKCDPFKTYVRRIEFEYVK